MRVFEALASGSMLLTDQIANGQSELFQPGVHLAEYSDDQTLLNRVAYYLNNPDERELIASQGLELAKQHHTYSHRVQNVMETIFTAGGPKYAAKVRTMQPAEVCQAYAKVYTHFQMVDALLYQFRLAQRLHGASSPIFAELLSVFCKRLYRAIRYQ